MTTKRLRVTQIRSKNGRLREHKSCLLGLGIRRMNQTVYVEDNPSIRGMLSKVSYLLRIEEA
jgi:large subunit ribosomal protein L30